MSHILAGWTGGGGGTGIRGRGAGIEGAGDGAREGGGGERGGGKWGKEGAGVISILFGRNGQKWEENDRYKYILESLLDIRCFQLS